MPRALRGLSRRVGKEVAHLTYGRLAVTPADKPWRHLEIATALRPIAQRFGAAVRANVLRMSTGAVMADSTRQTWRDVLRYALGANRATIRRYYKLYRQEHGLPERCDNPDCRFHRDPLEWNGEAFRPVRTAG
jgi:hypothetical protein